MQRFRHQWNEHRHLPHEDARLHIKQKRSIRWLTWHRGLVWGKERLPHTPIPYNTPFVRTLRRGAHDPNCWVRDVHEEGIEPHPGPWFITKNINGMNNKRKQCQVFKNIKLAHSKTPIGAIMLQEHHLKADAAKEADKLAHDFRLLFLCKVEEAVGGGKRSGD